MAHTCCGVSAKVRGQPVGVTSLLLTRWSSSLTARTFTCEEAIFPAHTHCFYTTESCGQRLIVQILNFLHHIRGYSLLVLHLPPLCSSVSVFGFSSPTLTVRLLNCGLEFLVRVYQKISNLKVHHGVFPAFVLPHWSTCSDYKPHSLEILPLCVSTPTSCVSVNSIPIYFVKHLLILTPLCQLCSFTWPTPLSVDCYQPWPLTLCLYLLQCLFTTEPAGVLWCVGHWQVTTGISELTEKNHRHLERWQLLL